MDNDELIDLLERTPTYKRKPDEKTAIREKRHVAAVAAQPARVMPDAKSPKKSGTSGTINFGE